MKNLSFAVVSAILVSVLVVSQSGVIDVVPNEVKPYSIIDPIIKALLESMRSKLVNLKIDDINEVVRNPILNANVSIVGISIQNADKFEIRTLKSDLIPLRLTNLTLTWNDIMASADYDIGALINVPNTKGSINLFGKGSAKAVLSDLYFTIGANVELKDKAIQIKPKGLFGFDLRIGRAKVTLTSLMGSSDFGNTVGMIASKIIPELVEVFKKPIFNAFQDDIIVVINQILKNKKNLFMDEEPLPILESSESFLNNLDLNEESNSLFKDWLDSGMEETEFEFESES